MMMRYKRSSIDKNVMYLRVTEAAPHPLARPAPTSPGGFQKKTVLARPDPLLPGALPGGR
jgi:hypothetical protein